MIHEEMQV